MFIAPVLRLVSRRAPAMARAAHRAQVRPFKPQMRCFTHALYVVDVSGLGATYTTVRIVVQEAKAQL